MLTIKLAMNEIIQTTKLKIRHILECGHKKNKRELQDEVVTSCCLLIACLVDSFELFATLEKTHFKSKKEEVKWKANDWKVCKKNV